MMFDLERLTLNSHMKLILFIPFFHLVLLFDLFQWYLIKLIFSVEAEVPHL